MRALRASLAAVGFTLLCVLAVIGVTLSAVVLYVATPAGRREVASIVIRIADEEVAGSLRLGGLDLRPGGAFVVRNFEAYDPDGRLVLQVDRLVVAADVTRLRNRVVGLDVELDGAAVLLDEDGEGRLSLARAFAPAHPSPPEAPRARRPFWEDPLAGWTIRLGRLAVRDTSFWWQDAAGNTRLEAQDLQLDARGRLGPGRGRVEVSLHGQSIAPIPGPLLLETRVLLDGSRLRVPILRAQLGETALQGLADTDLARKTGRAALTRATVARQNARELVKGAPPGADLALDAYAEADGQVATAALHLQPAGATGGGDAAVALRLDGARAVGFDVVARALDPSALHAAAPSASVSLGAHGGLSGETLGTARGNLDLDLAPSRLRGGEVGPAAAMVRLDRGSWDVSRLSLEAPGIRVQGAGSFQQGGGASARFTAEVADLARAAENAGRLLGRTLPRAAGRARVDATLAGTAAAPVVSAKVTAPALAMGRTSVAGIDAHVDASGPFRPGELRVQARVQRLSSGEHVVAQGLSLEAAVTRAPSEPGVAAATLTASGLVPSLGREPVSLEAAATSPADRKTLRLSVLSIAYPGTRYALEAPATVTLEGPQVDRLSLIAGPRRIAVEGGMGARSALDARLEVVRLDLARLPAGLLPAEDRIAGELSADARATGTLARPRLEGSLSVERGGFRSEQGLGVKGTLRYDGGARRAALTLGVVRAGGGSADLAADLPLPLRGRPGEAVSADLRAEGLPIPALLQLAGTEAPLQGALGATARLEGTVGSPSLRARATVTGGAFRELDRVALDASASVAREAEVTAEVRLADRLALRLAARTPMAMAALLADPGRALKGLRDAKLTADATLTGLDLAAVSGRLGIPSGLRGQLTGEAHATGRPDALRGTTTLSLADGAYAGYTGITARVEAASREDRVDSQVSAQLHGQELLRLTAALRAPVERLLTRAGLDAAGVLVDATVPGVDLETAAAPAGVALGGVVNARLHAEGTLAHPVVQLDGTGRSVLVKGRPVGQLQVALRAAGDRASGELTLAPPAGGRLTATAAVTVPISIDVRAAALRAAPTEVRVRADAVDLGFVPAVLPAMVRSAAGKLEADVTAAGPLAQLAPRGTVRLAGGRLALVEYGDWTGIELDGAVTEDAVEIRTLDARRGEGTLQVRAALRGLTTAAGRLEGRIEARKLTFSRAGMDLATVTMGVTASGTYKARRLEARLDIPDALVRLADKLPRELQSLDQRPDIVIGPKPPQPKAVGPKVASAPTDAPFTFSIRVVAPGGFKVQRVSPRINLELRADVTYERQTGGDYMSGSVQVIRGFVEPLADRRFDVKRARLTFTGGPPAAALLDAEAVYTNPVANVTVTVSGTVTKPGIHLSAPGLDETQIAMLIATGQTELRAGGGGAAGAAQDDLSKAAAQKLGFAVFNTFIRDQLPFAAGDISLDASAAKVSGYIPGTRIYVGFTRRFDANRQQGENEEEVHLEYSITPHWTLEGRWGTASTGGASLIWSKDY